MGNGGVHPRGHLFLFGAQDGLVLVANQIKGRPAAPCSPGKDAAKCAAIDGPLGSVDKRLFRIIEIRGDMPPRLRRIATSEMYSRFVK